jgi:hypothetical protein
VRTGNESIRASVLHTRGVVFGRSGVDDGLGPQLPVVNGLPLGHMRRGEGGGGRVLGEVLSGNHIRLAAQAALQLGATTGALYKNTGF